MESARTNKANFEGCWAKKSPGEQKELEQTRPTLKFALVLTGSGYYHVPSFASQLVCKSVSNFTTNMIYTLEIFEGVYIYVSSVNIFFYLKKSGGNMPQANIYQNPAVPHLVVCIKYSIQMESSHFSSGLSYRYIVNIS